MYLRLFEYEVDFKKLNLKVDENEYVHLFKVWVIFIRDKKTYGSCDSRSLERVRWVLLSARHESRHLNL